MKKSELFFSFIQVPLDYAMIVLAALSAFYFRDAPQILAQLPKLYKFPFEGYLNMVLLVAPVFLVIYALEGLYNIRATRKFWQEFHRIFVATSIGLFIIIIAIFLKREWFSSRFIILASWFFAIMYVAIIRYILQRIQKWLLVKKGLGVHRVLLIGNNGKLSQIKKILERKKELGYKIIGHTEYINLKEIKEIKKLKGIDEIFLCDPSIADDLQEKLIDYCAINRIAYQYVPTVMQTSRIAMRMIGDEPVIEVKHTPLDGWGSILKRIFDVIGSLILLILFSPILLLTALAIRLDSRGPIIYKNERIGGDGKKFFVYKFRYMKWEYCVSRENPQLEDALNLEKKLIAEKSVRQGPLYKIKNDPRKTRVGAFIEKYSIDELPQFFNTLKGDMSLVGPRPHQEREVEKYREYHRRLLTIRPGITGMAQISGRSDLDFEREYRLDVYYIENWSLWLDVQICLKTLGVLFARRKN